MGFVILWHQYCDSPLSKTAPIIIVSYSMPLDSLLPCWIMASLCDKYCRNKRHPSFSLFLTWITSHVSHMSWWCSSSLLRSQTEELRPATKIQDQLASHMSQPLCIQILHCPSILSDCNLMTAPKLESSS